MGLGMEKAKGIVLTKIREQKLRFCFWLLNKVLKSENKPPVRNIRTMLSLPDMMFYSRDLVLNMRHVPLNQIHKRMVTPVMALDMEVRKIDGDYDHLYGPSGGKPYSGVQFRAHDGNPALNKREEP